MAAKKMQVARFAEVLASPKDGDGNVARGLVDLLWHGAGPQQPVPRDSHLTLARSAP